MPDPNTKKPSSTPTMDEGVVTEQTNGQATSPTKERLRSELAKGLPNLTRDAIAGFVASKHFEQGKTEEEAKALGEKRAAQMVRD